MSAFAALTLQNNAAANVVFSPDSRDISGVVKYFAPGASIDAQPFATFSVRRPKNGSNVARITGKVVVPIMSVVDSTVKVADTMATFEIVMPKQATSTLRLDIRRMLQKLLDDTITTAAVTNLESVN